MSTVTEQVRSHVDSKPGVHFNALAADLDIATGQAQYHLRKLRRAGDIVAEEIQGKTHYYSREYDPWERRVLAFARRETARTILLHLLEAESLSADELADRLGVARSTVSWHVSALADADTRKVVRGTGACCRGSERSGRDTAAARGGPTIAYGPSHRPVHAAGRRRARSRLGRRLNCYSRP